MTTVCVILRPIFLRGAYFIWNLTRIEYKQNGSDGFLVPHWIFVWLKTVTNFTCMNQQLELTVMVSMKYKFVNGSTNQYFLR